MSEANLAKETLILHPPEKSFVAFSIIFLVKPKPDKIFLALASAE